MATGPSLQTERREFDEVLEAWSGSLKSPSTRSGYRSDLGSFARWSARSAVIPLTATSEDVAAYQAACLESGDTASTVRRRSSALMSFFDFALVGGFIATNPVIGVARPLVTPGDPSATAMLDAGYVDDLLASASRLDSRLHALVALLVLDGVKLGEALSLDTADVSGRQPKVTVRVHRNGRAHLLQLDPRTAGAVRRCVGRRRGEPLFISRRPQADDAAVRLSRFGADHLLKRLSDPLGVPLTANALRRFFVSSTHRSGVDLDSIRDRAGLADRRGVQRLLSRASSSPRVRASSPSKYPVDHGSDRRSTNKEV